MLPVQIGADCAMAKLADKNNNGQRICNDLVYLSVRFIEYFEDRPCV